MTRVSGSWLEAKGTQLVMKTLEEAGFEAFAVGGCVRNALLGEPVADVDISTSARPEDVLKLAKASGLKAIPTGIDHGTITVVANGEPYEVTTYRADVETDGRRAVVRFAQTMKEDAIRRDFTMNALYADRHGLIKDPLGGLEDLRARRFRFIQDAQTRIREDYLRILRYFRFTAWYGNPEAGVDPEALAAIAENLDGLDHLSRERVGAELCKLFAAPDPTVAVSVMEQTGVLHRIMPGATTRALGPLIIHEQSMALGPDALRRMAATGFFDGAALRLSKQAQKQLALLQCRISDSKGLPEIAWRDGGAVAQDVAVLRAAMLEMPLASDTEAQIQAGTQAQFPVTAKDLMPHLQGPALGKALTKLQRFWIASGFTLQKEALLKLLNQEG
ncbi:CCA tRNA nucleotidyltransferase [Pacificoceanicola onchidii]|uniref:CCA tRNA nucleotidyltransferase n=1 Tax=Pacificoceanicola onchidii TaxID=2562685 RepID=UPI0010A69854|nr:CCA tRNA nucleotidyltransferase [Pacificoceanicola onchidii]